MESHKGLKKFNSTIRNSRKNKIRKERKVKRENDTTCKYFRPFFLTIVFNDDQMLLINYGLKIVIQSTLS